MRDRFLFGQIDNSGLILFRICFGILISLECFGAIATGWVRRTLIAPKFTFTFIGFEWLQPLDGHGMYYYFGLMGCLGILICLGYRYRLSMIAFTILWTGSYLMQKTSYNNHYYLLILISFLMCFFPAEKDFSLDAKKNPGIRSQEMYAWVKWAIVLQLFLVYTYAAVAKVQEDWLNHTFIKLLMSSKADYYLLGGLLQQPYIHSFLSISGILFDLLIIPALLWKPTRILAFGCALFFHLFNSIVLQIGIFPYLSLAFTLFFFDPVSLRKRFLKGGQSAVAASRQGFPSRKLILWGGGLYFLIQLLLPVRHYFIQDDVLWTEEGHRLSWRMMLRNRTGTIQFRIENETTGKSHFVPLKKYVSNKQSKRLAAYPDFIWQFAQRLEKEYAAKGEKIRVYAISSVSINGKPLRPFIDPSRDLAAEPWDHFGHHDWILPSDPQKE